MHLYSQTQRRKPLSWNRNQSNVMGFKLMVRSYIYRNTSGETSKYFPSFQGRYPVQTRFWIAKVFTLSGSKRMRHETWTWVGMVLPIPPYQLSSNSQTNILLYYQIIKIEYIVTVLLVLNYLSRKVIWAKINSR